MSNKSNKAIKVLIKGKIQGVGYRANTHQKATQLGITGYIRNTTGSTIELVGEGEEESLNKLVDYLKVGPSGAEIEEIDVEWIEATGDHIRFAIKY
ncbi:acylphosphatase [Halonatronum saccharophilum]|uniref:acylphosphatase n=1 Tax=Halonatronum saccharophilum TaxID=150060 RepID=UPI000480B0A5|nr:acylphosphatase [Halonatronum saccharophilum]